MRYGNANPTRHPSEAGVRRDHLGPRVDLDAVRGMSWALGVYKATADGRGRWTTAYSEGDVGWEA